MPHERYVFEPLSARRLLVAQTVSNPCKRFRLKAKQTKPHFPPQPIDRLAKLAD